MSATIIDSFKMSHEQMRNDNSDESKGVIGDLKGI